MTPKRAGAREEAGPAAGRPVASTAQAESATSPLPSVALPKGGGAIRGIGEKFAPSPATGTGALTVPIATSPGRGAFAVALQLSYGSGSGNGPFGLGWQLSTPSITRKTDKGLPRYEDAPRESDVFVLSGAEDLVPSDAGFDHGIYRVQRYRPRIEGLFARIERWTVRLTGDTHWRVITRDNVLNVYGRSAAARIAAPGRPERVFSWLLEETRDDRGNISRYGYKAEDGAGVDPAKASEASRFTRLADGSLTFRATAQRYLKRIQYGNRIPVPDRGDPAPSSDDAWLFEVVFDYGEHDPLAPAPRDDERPGAPAWPARPDAFSSHRSTFEVRTYRLCRRVLMFHRFAELGNTPCLVRSTDFTYEEGPVVTYLRAVTHAGYQRAPGASAYRRATWPPLELEYTRPEVSDELRALDPASLEGIPGGIETTGAQWVDLDGEGIPGILISTARGWLYKSNLGAGRLAPPTLERELPLPADLRTAQLADLGGDGNLDLVAYAPPLAGYFERTAERRWTTFRPIGRLPRLDWEDRHLRFIDLDGDGFPDILISQHDTLVWYRSRGREGFDEPVAAPKDLDELRGPAVVFADGTETIHLADMNGDGLIDIVRIRATDVCYWPNRGHGSFGEKVTFDHCPRFDAPEQFDPRRVRLADIDGSGTTDLLYLGRDGVRLFFNESGNSFAPERVLASLPVVDSLTSLDVVDLLGSGTVCLLLSAPLPGDARRPVSYVDLMGGKKPHLLVRIVNNLGAETRIEYRPSTEFYLADRRRGRPWITRLPFPVHVITRVDVYDHISRNRFVARYAYHDGYFDGEEREFRGFGMAEQWDTEEISTLGDGGASPAGDNVDAATHVPPVLTRTWFHTGVHLGRDRISNFYAGTLDGSDAGEYYREPGLTDAEAGALLLEDTVLPPGLSLAEEREACRALKGAMLRQEIYALDGTARAAHPYTVAEQNFSVACLQRRGGNRHAVYLSRPRESLTYHYERNRSDPRVSHSVTLELDDFGNVLKSVAVGYGRRQPDPRLPLVEDRNEQTRTRVTYTESLVTTPVQLEPSHRAPLAAESRTYELTGYSPTGAAGRFRASDFVQPDSVNPARLVHVFDGELAYEEQPTGGRQRRLIEHVRTLYRADDLSGLLPLGRLDSRAMPGESYKLAFTPGLLARVFRRPRPGQPPEDLLPDPAAVLAGGGAGGGGYRASQDLKATGLFPGSDPDDHWWLPSGRVFHSPASGDDPAQELLYAQSHFFLPHRYRDAFHTSGASTERRIAYDPYDLLVVQADDAAGNRLTASHDYRVLQPASVRDANLNRSAVAFDARGMVVGTAVMGKVGESLGDTLTGFQANLDDAVVLSHLASPLTDPWTILGRATTRLVYDLFAYSRTRSTPSPEPVAIYTIARETHDAEAPGGSTKVQHIFSYSDGFGREIQKKVQAEPDRLTPGSPRWVGSGWTVFNNKGKPVRQYEAFFSDTHRFELARMSGVSSVVFYDPAERVVATLRPDHTYEKVLFDPWEQTTWDGNDTVLADPRTDPDVAGYVAGYFRAQPATWQTWYQQRIDGFLGTQEQAAARKTADHANTPATAYFDTLGRQFLSVAHNGFESDGSAVTLATRVEFDIEGNQLAVRDAVEQAGDRRGRLVAAYAYDVLSNRIHQTSLDSGPRWTISDAAGKPLRSWDGRGHVFRMEFDRLRRPFRSYALGADPARPGQEVLVEWLIYGEQHPESAARNLRGEPHLYLDQAGALLCEARDFKGNHLHDARRLAAAYDRALDWTAAGGAIPADPTALIDPAAVDAALAPLLDGETFVNRTRYDALNRPIQITPPRSDRPGARLHVIQPVYSVANLLERVDVWLDRPAEPSGLLDPAVDTPSPVGVENIDYDAKGQRLVVEYRNGSSVRYEYDPLSLRLTRLYTRRGATYTGDCENDAPPPPTIPAPAVPPPGPCGLQNLHYTYDPVGNITHMRDRAQHTVYFRNRRVDATCDYTYDALYRLVSATGREHLGQVGGPPLAHSYNDAPRVHRPHPNDGNAMGRYEERYAYDEVGNLLEMAHAGADPADPGWTRTFRYEEPSATEAAKRGNRLTRTDVGSTAEVYSAAGDGFDAHGNMLRMPHLQAMAWDFRDQLRMTRRQAIDAADADGTQHHGERTWYVYDAAGTRVRKVTEAPNGEVREERVYVGTLEVYRTRGADPLVRETLHVNDGRQRVATVDTRTQGQEPGVPAQRIRFLLGDYLGSAVLELDEVADIVSFEEYTPYGSTSYQAVRSQVQASRRVRFVDHERDDETGLYHIGARYYACWLGRWASADPSGIAAGLDVYLYCSANPVSRRDRSGRTDDLLVRESNLFYDFDHYEPQSEYPQLSNKASNIGFVTADENRRKGAREFTDLPQQRQAVSLRKALDDGGDAARQAVSEMLGSRRFNEVTELNELWQMASKNETLPYSTAQANFRQLIAKSDVGAAKTVRQALAHAGIDIVPNGDSFRFRMKDASYRRSALKGKLKGAGGKAGIVVGVVGAMLTAESAFAYEPDLPKTVTEQDLESVESNAHLRIRVAGEVTTISDAAPGGFGTTVALALLSADAVVDLKAREFALAKTLHMKGSFVLVENAMVMLNQTTGDVYQIEESLLSAKKNAGDLTLVGRFQRSVFGFYYNDKNVIYKEENGKFYLRHWSP
jgi:RHS repeat-associated protein